MLSSNHHHKEDTLRTVLLVTADTDTTGPHAGPSDLKDAIIDALEDITTGVAVEVQP